MKSSFKWCVMALVLTPLSHAQERTAASALDTQITWTALSAKAEAAATKAAAVDARVDQVVVCGKKGMVYAPDFAGSDTQGCFQPVTDPSVTTNITALIKCNAEGQLFNGKTCVSSKPVIMVTGSQCPAGYSVIACTAPNSYSGTPTFSGNGCVIAAGDAGGGRGVVRGANSTCLKQ